MLGPLGRNQFITLARHNFHSRTAICAMNEQGVILSSYSYDFVTGDGSVPDAYFYATAYPAPEGWTDLTLPEGAYWHTEGWTGALLPYSALAASNHPEALLLDYLCAVQAHGKKLMA